MVNPVTRQLEKRLRIELAILVGLTTAVLLIFPQRPPWVNGILAIVGLSFILANRRFTREQVWGCFPVIHDRRYCVIHTTVLVGLFTLAGIILFAILGWWQAGASRLLNPHALAALTVYFLWGLLQQYLFQFYLLGRLLVALPRTAAIFCTALAYAIVHFPHAGTMAVTLVAGVVWTVLYYRYRVLLPLAVSHALLGSTLFYWVYGRDLLAHWLALAATPGW